MIWKLSKKNVSKLLYTFYGSKKHYTEKLDHCLHHANQICKSTNQELVTEDNVEDFLKALRVWQEIYKHEYIVRQLTDSATQPFEKVDRIEQGMIVHVSWLHKGAKFKIVEIHPDFVMLDNPKYSRLLQGKQLLKVYNKDLRKLR